MIGGGGSGASWVGAAMGWASTIGCHDSGPVWTTKPLWPLLMPPCESMITGLRTLSAAANALGAAQSVVSTTAIAVAIRDCDRWTHGMGDLSGLKMPDHAKCLTLPRRC